jgi:hypothetical protein
MVFKFSDDPFSEKMWFIAQPTLRGRVLGVGQNSLSSYWLGQHVHSSHWLEGFAISTQT